ncbi:hypothetical protein BHE74_00050769 [Ensete ventricosum]|nr:hypothetical protein GW17_00052915 [Ensete ventricosum]RWW43544.1 hypothetical protein BHE74_00050769 [Ensete ventricosum]
MLKLLTRIRGEMARTVVALRHCQRLLTALAESKGVALDLAEGSMAKSSKLSTMAVTLVRRLGFVGNPKKVVAKRLAAKGLLGDQGFLVAQGCRMARDSWPYGCS